MKSIIAKAVLTLSIMVPAAHAGEHGPVKITQLATYDAINLFQLSKKPSNCSISGNWFSASDSLWAILNTTYAKGAKVWIYVDPDRSGTCVVWGVSTTPVAFGLDKGLKHSEHNPAN